VANASENAGSGGYLEHIFRYAAEALHGLDVWDQPLVYVPGRNLDIAELDIEQQEGYKKRKIIEEQQLSQMQQQDQHQQQPQHNNEGREGASMEVDTSTNSSSSHNEGVALKTSSLATNPKDTANVTGEKMKLKFVKAYGFRNIQSILLKQKSGRHEIDFIEIMACPSGCVNGGGQLKRATAMVTAAATTTSTTATSAMTTSSSRTAPTMATASSAPTTDASGAERNVEKNRSIPDVSSSNMSVRESPAETKERVASTEALFHQVAAPLRRCEDSPLVRYLYSLPTSTAATSNTTVTTTDTASTATISIQLNSTVRDSSNSDSGIRSGSCSGNVTGRVEPEAISGSPILGRPFSKTSIELLHTRYHTVPKLELVAPLAAKW
jgi:hypothetical protein